MFFLVNNTKLYINKSRIFIFNSIFPSKSVITSLNLGSTVSSVGLELFTIAPIDQIQLAIFTVVVWSLRPIIRFPSSFFKSIAFRISFKKLFNSFLDFFSSFKIGLISSYFSFKPFFSSSSSFSSSDSDSSSFSSESSSFLGMMLSIISLVPFLVKIAIFSIVTLNSYLTIPFSFSTVKSSLIPLYKIIENMMIKAIRIIKKRLKFISSPFHIYFY